MKIKLISLSVLSFILIECKNSTKNKDSEFTTSIKKNTILIKGSDTELLMVHDISKAYQSQHPDITIDVLGGGSGVGIEALINNEVDIANSSREIKPEEILRAEKNGVHPVPIMFAVDALAIITNSQLGVDSLSTDQLTQIFSGEITNWKSLGGPDLGIIIFGRDTVSGTYSYIKDKFMKRPYYSSMKHLVSNLSIVKAVQENKGGIGYTGAGFLMDEKGKPNGSIWAMPIYIKGSRAYSPYEKTAVQKGDYVLTRPLYQYINGKVNSLLYDFIIHELTLRAQEIIKNHGYFPINDCQIEINKLNGL